MSTEAAERGILLRSGFHAAAVIFECRRQPPCFARHVSELRQTKPDLMRLHTSEKIRHERHIRRSSTHTHDKGHRAFWLNVYEFCHSSVRSCPADPVYAIITTQRVEELSKKLIDAANCLKKQSENSVPSGPYEQQFPPNTMNGRGQILYKENEISAVHFSA